jgi:hypothetical protein
MFVRNGDADRARALVQEAAAQLPRLADVTNDPGERQRIAWLRHTVLGGDNVWRGLPARGIRRVAIFGGEGWGLAIQRQLADAGVACVAVIDNNAGTREAAMIPAPYYSQAEFLARRPAVDAVVSSLQGDHDRAALEPLQTALGTAIPVISWKALFQLDGLTGGA